MKYKVLANTLSWISNKSFKAGDEIDEKVFGVTKTKELIKRGFLVAIKEEEIEEIPLSKLKKDELIEILVELGVEEPKGNKEELIAQIEEIKKDQV